MGHVTLDWLLQGKKNKGLLNTTYIYASRGNLWLQDSYSLSVPQTFRVSKCILPCSVVQIIETYTSWPAPCLTLPLHLVTYKQRGANLVTCKHVGTKLATYKQCGDETSHLQAVWDEASHLQAVWGQN